MTNIPPSTTTKEAMKHGDWLFRQKCEFVLSAASSEGLPRASLPEFAFLGRSNVGKSSLLNALLHRKELARVSNTPGRTQQLNFFRLHDQCYLVDMPGYGFAKVSKKDQKHWQRLIMDYLFNRPTLKRLYLLGDARHGLKPNDLGMMEILTDAAISFQIVMTKADKIKKTAIEPLLQATQDVLADYPAAFPEVILTSSEKKTGLDDLRGAIAQLLLS